jgi:hypothetical protein
MAPGWPDEQRPARSGPIAESAILNSQLAIQNNSDFSDLQLAIFDSGIANCEL